MTSATGSLRANITSEANLTLGEDRTIRWTVVDADGVDVVSFSGWTFGFYLLPSQGTARTSASVLITKTSSSGITSSAPDVDVALDPADTIDLTARGYFYELWRTDVDDVVRLAYGQFTFID